METFEIVATLLAAILALFTTYKWKEIKWFSRFALIICVIAAIATATGSLFRSKKDRIVERVNAKFGELVDEHGAVVPRLRIGNGNEGSILILEGTGTLSLFQFGPLLKLYVRDGKLYVNALIRNLNGNVIAVIEDNTWTLFDEDYEYNDDNATAFEMVTRGERKVFFQIEMREGMACVSGYLLNDKGNGLILYNKPEAQGSFMYYMATEEAKTKIPADIAVPRLFKYPREKYYGIRL